MKHRVTVHYKPEVEGLPMQGATLEHTEVDRFTLRPIARTYQVANSRSKERRTVHETFVTPKSLRALADQLEHVSSTITVDV